MGPKSSQSCVGLPRDLVPRNVNADLPSIKHVVDNREESIVNLGSNCRCYTYLPASDSAARNEIFDFLAVAAGPALIAACESAFEVEAVVDACGSV